MKSIYYSELAHFINLENINFKGKEIRKGTGKFDINKYDPNHGLIQGHIKALQDLSTLGKSILQYPMGSGIEMTLFNLIMQAKGLLADSVPHKATELNINISIGSEFAVYLDVEEDDNVFSRIRISNYRKFELTGKPSQHTIKIAKNVKNKFNALAALNL